MKTFVMTITTPLLLVLIFALCTMFFPPLVQSRVFPPMDANDVIEQMCKQTPNYKLCASFLPSEPWRSHADVSGLALIMVGVIEAEAKETLSHIKELIKTSPKLYENQPLSSRVDNYNAIITSDVPEAIQALKTGNYKFSEQGTNDAAVEAEMCEKSFSGKNPLTERNKLEHDVALIGAAITRILLNS